MKTPTPQASRCYFVRQPARKRHGVVLVLSALLMIVMMAIIALSVDVGYIQHVQTEMDRAVDAGALAGVGALPAGIAAAEATAIEFTQLNPVATTQLDFTEIDVEPGYWNDVQRQFTVGNNLPSAIRVSAERFDQRPLFFAKVFGVNEFNLRASAVAVFQPRDIMVVLDYSASMNDDSEFKTIPVLGREAVETNLLKIYQELGSPGLGTMQFPPQFMTVVGATARQLTPSSADGRISVQLGVPHIDQTV